MPQLAHSADEQMVVAGGQEPWLGLAFDVAEHSFAEFPAEEARLFLTLHLPGRKARLGEKEPLFRPVIARYLLGAHQ
jgi:hypothetical protein